METKEHDWMIVEGLDEVQVFGEDGTLIESYTGDELSVELFHHEPSED